MSLTPAVLYSGGQLTTSPAALFTCPANTKAVLTPSTFANLDTVARVLTVYLVRAGQTAGAANTLIPGVTIAAGDSLVPDELPGQTLGVGDSIQAKADVAATITCVGLNGYLVT
jgi:hypothetical protein